MYPDQKHKDDKMGLHTDLDRLFWFILNNASFVWSIAETRRGTGHFPGTQVSKPAHFPTLALFETDPVAALARPLHRREHEGHIPAAALTNCSLQTLLSAPRFPAFGWTQKYFM